MLMEFNPQQYTVGILLKKPLISPYFKGKGLVREALCECAKQSKAGWLVAAARAELGQVNRPATP